MLVRLELFQLPGWLLHKDGGYPSTLSHALKMQACTRQGSLLLRAEYPRKATWQRGQFKLQQDCRAR